MQFVEEYFKSLSEVFRTGGGTEEESFYGALETLLNQIGSELKPPIRCVQQLRNTGAGEPDFGLYSANQFQDSAKDSRPIEGALPERGVIEVKGWKEDAFLTAQTDQVTRYWEKYGLVLVTNYRDFVLIGRDAEGRAIRLESHRLAESESAFLELLAHPHKSAQAHGARLAEFLMRVLLYEAALANPEDLAWFLASYAREARGRVEAARDLPALEGLKNGLEQTLGMTFEGDKGQHFFRATLVQTLFYGVFSSWVLWSRDHWGQPEARFDWRNAAWTLHVPMIASLIEQIATPKRLKPLGVDEVLDWAGAALNRVDRAAFFQKFEEEHAVQYFYEPFLKAYDPELRKELGVWFTPPEIVQYQVERVDRVLREELGIADGLADSNVVILDPCCGTGAYLVETLKRIHKTLVEKGASALTGQKLKQAAMERVFGFEILPAPFVVAHLQLGMMLRHLGVPLDHDSEQRAGVYLTNALTGWEPPQGPKGVLIDRASRTEREFEPTSLMNYPEFMEEKEAADRVKRDAPILVILGNPPYNAFAGTSPEEEGGLVEPYKEGLTTPVEKGGWGIKKFNLDDLYVRFFRIAERRIAKSGKGVVTFISNYSWTSEPSFVVLRKRLLESFDKLWIENMHGNRKISEYAPDGRTSETVFAIPGFSEGIQQGVVVSLWVRKDGHDDKTGKHAKVLYRNDIDAARAAQRRQQLLESLNQKGFDRRYEKSKPSPANRFSFRPSSVDRQYLKWPRVVDLCEVPPSNGLMEKRGGALMDIDRKALEKRMRLYFDRRLSWEAAKLAIGSLAENAARYNAKSARERLLAEEHFDPQRIMRYAIRPFDTIWCYYSGVRPLWNEPRPSYFSQCWKGNGFFMTRFRSSASPEGAPCAFVSGLSDDHYIVPDNSCFPIRLRHGIEDGNGRNNYQGSVFDEAQAYVTYRANLSAKARAYLDAMGISKPDQDAETARLIWMHALAIGYSRDYLSENADGVRQDWPRIPLPATKKALAHSAALGRRAAALLDTEKPVEGATCGKIGAPLLALGLIRKVGGGELDPIRGELDLTAGWGHSGKNGVCMPGKGKIEKRPLKDSASCALFGDAALDIYLNNTAYWADVPEAVWNYTIGGYQVIKKWLSYREKAILGRGLTMEEAEYVTEMIRRIAALVLLQPELDANYEAVKADAWQWPE